MHSLYALIMRAPYCSKHDPAQFSHPRDGMKTSMIASINNQWYTGNEVLSKHWHLASLSNPIFCAAVLHRLQSNKLSLMPQRPLRETPRYRRLAVLRVRI
jgi:hypothetical protein